MRVLPGPGAGEWLRGRVTGPVGSVRSVTGGGFAAYARILHPAAGRLLDWTDRGAGMVPRVIDERDVTWAEVAASVGRVTHPLVQWRALVPADQRDFRWDDGWEIEGPREGWFDPVEFARLVPLLAEATATPDDAVVALWEGWGELHPGSRHVVVEASPGTGAAPAHVDLPMLDRDLVAALDAGDLLDLPGRRYVLLGGELSELGDPDWGFRAGIGWWDQFRSPSPQLVWPADRAWVVATEIDFDSTLVAGSRAQIDAVLALPGIEACEVAEDGDLTWGGDAVNGEVRLPPSGAPPPCRSSSRTRRGGAPRGGEPR